jgi:hypothetical protein
LSSPSGYANTSASQAASPSSSPSTQRQETLKRPTAALDRNLQYLSLVEILYGYPIDGMALTTGCDKTTPAQIMAAATVDIPAIVLSGSLMLNGFPGGDRVGAGTIVWRRAREMLANDDWERIGHDNPAARQRAARWRVPGRGLPSRWRGTGGGGRADRQGQDRRGHPDRERQVAGRQLQGVAVKYQRIAATRGIPRENF